MMQGTHLNVICPKCNGTHLHDHRLCNAPPCTGTGFVLVPVTKQGTDRLIADIFNGIGGRK